MAYFDFSRLINKYSTDFTVLTSTTGGYDEAGDWQAGEQTETKMHGAIISYKESKIFRAEGTLTANDKRLFLLQPIDSKLIGATAIYNGRKYNIEDCTENAQFTGVWAYTLKYVSAFKNKGGGANG